jgi:hypothetical protein
MIYHGDHEKPETRSVYTSVYLECIQVSFGPNVCCMEYEDVDRSSEELEIHVYRVTLSCRWSRPGSTQTWQKTLTSHHLLDLRRCWEGSQQVT